MSMQLIVHVGANKTGSSAIQKFLSLNHEELHARGFVVPSQEFAVARQVPGFHVFAFEKLFRSPDGRRELESAIRAIAAAEPDASAIVLSAENLAANPAAPALFAGLREDFDLRVILYVRRQDDYLLSSWQQWYSKVHDDFWAWALREVGVMGDWSACLRRWESVVPRESITVRVFERARLVGGDVIRDFHEQLGLAPPFEEWSYPQVKVNPSYTDAVMDLVKGNPLVFENAHDNGFYDFVSAMTGDRYFRRSRESPITFAQRISLLRKYADGNRWVRDAYFPGEREELFSPPARTDYDYPSREDRRTEQLEFLTAMLYRMHSRRE